MSHLGLFNQDKGRILFEEEDLVWSKYNIYNVLFLYHLSHIHSVSSVICPDLLFP